MVIAFPRSIPDEMLVTGMSFPPAPMSAVTPLRSGKIISKDLGPTLWRPTWRADRLLPAQVGIVRAWYDTLLSVNEFYGYDKLREYPLAYYPDGFAGLTVGGNPFGGTARLTAVESNTVEISLDSLPVGFVLSPGDYVAWDYLSGASRALHRVSAAATAGGGGTLTVEVRPHVRPGWAVNATVALYRAAARMIILPGTYSEEETPLHFTSIAFEAIQTL